MIATIMSPIHKRIRKGSIGIYPNVAPLHESTRAYKNHRSYGHLGFNHVMRLIVKDSDVVHGELINATDIGIEL